MNNLLVDNGFKYEISQIDLNSNNNLWYDKNIHRDTIEKTRTIIYNNHEKCKKTARNNDE